MCYQMKGSINTRMAFFAPNLAGGGAERIISILVRYFSELGYTVDLLLSEKKGPYLVDIPSSVNIIDFKCEKVLYTLPKLVTYLKKKQPDILFSSQMHVSTIAIWAKYLARVETKVIIRQPTMLSPKYERKSWSVKFKQHIFLKTSKLAYKIVVTSENMAEEFLSFSKLPKKNIEVIYNPVPLEVIRRKSQDFPKNISFSLDIPIILGVGRLVDVKGFKSLIKAFHIVKKSVPSQLIILGEGPLRNDLEALVKEFNLSEDVHILGFVENPYAYMKLSKVFVLSSLWEGFPNSMVEAMTCGTAIISTNCEGGASEILENGKWGTLVAIGDEQKMASAIIETLKDNKLPDVAKRVNDFSIEAVCKEYIRIFGVD